MTKDKEQPAVGMTFAEEHSVTDLLTQWGKAVYGADYALPIGGFPALGDGLEPFTVTFKYDWTADDQGPNG